MEKSKQTLARKAKETKSELTLRFHANMAALADERDGLRMRADAFENEIAAHKRHVESLKQKVLLWQGREQAVHSILLELVENLKETVKQPKEEIPVIEDGHSETA